MKKRWIVPAGTAAIALAAFACGGGSRGGSGSPTQPTPPQSGGSSTPAATIEIRNGAVNPRDVRIEIGQMVEFVNNDSVAREIFSTPHGLHNECPETNQVGRLQPGQRKTTGQYRERKVCGFHDHLDPENLSLRGTIRVAVDEPAPPPTYARP